MKLTKQLSWMMAVSLVLCCMNAAWAECSFSPPDGSTYPAKYITSSKAVLKGGLVDDGGLPTQYRFHYWSENGPQMTTPWEPFSATIGNIATKRVSVMPDTRYYYVIEVRNAVGSFMEHLPRIFDTLARITLASSDGGSVAMPGEGSFDNAPGTSIAVEAVPDEGQVFTGWSGSAVLAGLVEDPLAAATVVDVAGNYHLCANFAKAVPFSLGAYGDITIDNGPRYGQEGSGNGSGLEARDIPDRRHVFLVSYDISDLKARGLVSSVSFSHFSHDVHNAANVYGVIEDMDLLDVESLTWATAPGVQNDPLPELNSPVALDMADLTGPLLTFEGPGETGVRFSTDTSAALADFVNSDTDGILTFLFAPAAEGNQLIVRSREHAAGGSLLEGLAPSRGNITWVTDTADYDADGGQDDQGFIDLLMDAGYCLDVRPDHWAALEGVDANDANDYVAELNMADLVIISRSANSGNYDDGNEPALWNSVTTPMIQMSNWLLRSSRWLWINSTASTRSNLSFMEVLDSTHPVFAGVEIDPDGLVEPVDPLAFDEAEGYQGLSFLPSTDVGNGTLLAQSLEGSMWIAEWAPGVEFYEGAGMFATGRRLLFNAGTENASLGAGVFPAGANTLNAAGTQMYLNAVAYMINEPLVENGSFEMPGTAKTTGWNGEAGEDIAGWMSDSAAANSGVESDWPGSTDGVWTAFLMDVDPSVYQLTSHMIGECDVITLSLDARDNWTDDAFLPAKLEVSLYYGDGAARITLAGAVLDLTDRNVTTWASYELKVAPDSVPASIGHYLGVEINNVSGGDNQSWIGVDNVRVTVE